jgi:hypothetical protein
MMEQVQVVTKIERSPKGLVEALFNSLDGLNAGIKSADDVRAVAHTARSIVGIARLEMEATRMAETLGRKVEFTSLPGLGARATPQQEQIEKK